MEKKEVYDYLAKIYLDKQPAAKIVRKAPEPSKKYITFILIALGIAIVSAGAFLKYQIRFFKPKAFGLYVATGSELIKLKYNFNNSSTKKEGYSVTLSDINAQDYQHLQFQARSLTDDTGIKIRVEVENNLKENAFSYIDGVSGAWKEFTLKLSDFKGLTRWDNVNKISFIIEEWNVVGKENSVFIDEIRLIKKK